MSSLSSFKGEFHKHDHIAHVVCTYVCIYIFYEIYKKKIMEYTCITILGICIFIKSLFSMFNKLLSQGTVVW